MANLKCVLVLVYQTKDYIARRKRNLVRWDNEKKQNSIYNGKKLSAWMGWEMRESSSSYDFWNTQKLSAATDVWMKWILFYRASGEIWGRDACNAWNNIICEWRRAKGPKERWRGVILSLDWCVGGRRPNSIHLSLSQSVDCLLQLSSFSAFLIRTEVCGQAIWPAQFRAVGPLRPRQNNLRRTFSAQFGSSLRNEKSLFYHIGHSCHADFTEYSNNCFFGGIWIFRAQSYSGHWTPNIMDNEH
jgi:hypothetical protein